MLILMGSVIHRKWQCCFFITSSIRLDPVNPICRINLVAFVEAPTIAIKTPYRQVLRHSYRRTGSHPPCRAWPASILTVIGILTISWNGSSTTKRSSGGRATHSRTWPGTTSESPTAPSRTGVSWCYLGQTQLVLIGNIFLILPISISFFVTMKFHVEQIAIYITSSLSCRADMLFGVCIARIEPRDHAMYQAHGSL